VVTVATLYLLAVVCNALFDALLTVLLQAMLASYCCTALYAVNIAVSWVLSHGSRWLFLLIRIWLLFAR
jgi:hypothetical protein